MLVHAKRLGSPRLSACEVHPLEPRVFLSAGAPYAHELHILPAMRSTASLAKLKTLNADQGAVKASSNAIPVLHSNPLAPVTIYLDFDGDTTARWLNFKPGVTPAYDRDGDAGSFSEGEVAAIRDIWARVSEFYSPFDVNVTTVNPGKLADRQAVRIVFGGAGKWLGDRAGGVAPLSGFFDSSPNTVFAFTDNLHNGDPKIAAIVAAHEAAHAFGLEHQSLWNGNQLVDEYHPGDAKTAPIMGGNYDTHRSLWWFGPSFEGPDVMQDDLAVLTDPVNGIPYRADDYGGTLAGAKRVTLSNRPVTGVIGSIHDADVFSFRIAKGGYIDLSAATPAGGMLAYTLDLINAAGKTLKSLSAAAERRTVTTKLAAGSYYVRVASHKGIGDIGQYALTISQGNPPPPTPTGVSATGKSPSEIIIRWKDTSNHERGYIIQRSADRKSWTHFARVNANQTEFRDRNLSPETSYFYRVVAYNSAGYSRFSAPDEGRTMRQPANLSNKSGGGSGALTGKSTFSAMPVKAAPDLHALLHSMARVL